MTELPQKFLERMKNRAGLDFPAFLQSYERPTVKGVRINTLKLTCEEFDRIAPFPLLGAVPWEGNGRYAEEEKLGGFVEHFAGLFYSQEPSAMCAVPLLNVQPGERVLDLCAAPGGKTTQIAQAMQGKGILIANEYVYDRAKILLQNIERIGVKNCTVVSADSTVLAEKLPAYFDKILVDAPCSGEGMFKKEPAAIPEWSLDNVARCAVRQSEILENAAKMLRAGGRMVYSTCTFSEEEDEEQVRRFLSRHLEFRLLEQHTLFPHEVLGEGHFAALLEKTDGSETPRFREEESTRSGAALRAFEEFSKDFFVTKPNVRVFVGSGSIASLEALPDELPAFSGCSRLRNGVLLGMYENKVFKPAHALAMSVKREEVNRFVSLSREESERFLRGETTESKLSNGWCVVGFGEYPLGIGKIVNGVVKNHFPKGQRMIRRS